MSLLSTKVIRFLGIIIKGSGIAWDTDGSGDIGTATHRPRDIHLSRNLAAGGTGKVGTTFGVGAATPAASGAGVTFPAVQSASTDVNTLDDYKEGTFTPTIATGFDAPGYSAQSGTYEKIGKVVLFRLTVTVSSGTRNASTVTIGGLPFVPASVAGASYGFVSGVVAGGNALPVLRIVTSSAIELRTTNGVAVVGTDLTTAIPDFTISGFYFVA